MSVTLTAPWLEFDLGQQMQVLSWAPHRPGLVQARRILWREVRNADLPRDLDALDWLRSALQQRNASDAVCFLTSRSLSEWAQAKAQVGATQAHAVATVGLSNAERVGTRLDRRGQDWGTINLALRLNVGLNQTALLEALSIATQARTAAILDAAMDLPSGRATGTGTDCIAVAAPLGTQTYAGLHTELGEAIGRATYDVMYRGALDWLRTR